jgi:hypothetical protein
VNYILKPRRGWPPHLTDLGDTIIFNVKNTLVQNRAAGIHRNDAPLERVLEITIVWHL